MTDLQRNQAKSDYLQASVEMIASTAYNTYIQNIQLMRSLDHTQSIRSESIIDFDKHDMLSVNIKRMQTMLKCIILDHKINNTVYETCETYLNNIIIFNAHTRYSDVENMKIIDIQVQFKSNQPWYVTLRKSCVNPFEERNLGSYHPYTYYTFTGTSISAGFQYSEHIMNVNMCYKLLDYVICTHVISLYNSNLFSNIIVKPKYYTHITIDEYLPELNDIDDS